MSLDLARLALPEDPAVSALYWRGDAVVRAGGLDVAAGATLDLGTWFNAAPVAWWREVLGAGRVRLVVEGRGAVRVLGLVGGEVREVAAADVDGTWEAHLPRTDGVAWYWIELSAGPDGGRLDAVRWSAGRPARAVAPSVPQVTVVVPTYGREQDALEQVRRLLGPALDGVVSRVVLIDQARTVRAAEGAAEVVAAAGDRLTFVEQDNLGGSGGYSRGMLESLGRPQDAVLLLDDDARVEPEGLRRMVVLQSAAPVPTILGTPLISAEEPTRLEALAEGVRARGFVWGPSDGLAEPVDLAASTPAAWDFARVDARTDYSGWWGTLLPPGTVGRLGLAAPYFLKWDDAEYGLRASRAGMAVRTVPGTGTWHPTWAAKGTNASWSALPLHRNRLATALAYGAGLSTVLDSCVHQIKHVLSLQYLSADLWDDAIVEVLEGPAWLMADLRDVRPRAQAVVDSAPRALAVPGPAVEGAEPLGTVRGVLRALGGLVRPAGGSSVVAVEPAAFTWSEGLGRDAVVLGAGEGARDPLVRDPRRARAALGRTLALHGRLARRWRALSAEYARALPPASSAERWHEVLGTSPSSPGSSAS
ncbi:glycosyltransferase [Sanguibacter sp. HDW7]|uniref:glycosyltransferase n=1 Tax=Sanguibacter sp. HDW7 TaxID=2714931 RepID=UPI00140E84CE|nr:glycosyltransferase [Sanguibacter sp. HDW7]QIK82859.1 glycosyltransferase family 2 protein [Sanguibacter sp. HDW7]